MLALLLALFWISTSGGVAQITPFNFDQTLRVDYFHTGGPKSGETFALDRVLNDGLWPGSRQQPIDQTNLGPYRMEARDVASGDLLYSRGFASVYGEWETTAEARKIHRTFHESVRMPWPVRPVRIAIQKRQATSNEFAEVWSIEIDPGSRFVNSAPPVPRGKVWTLFKNGPADRKVDLLLISEGYTEAELPKFHRDAERLVGALFAQEPFKSRRSDFNVRGLDLPSPRNGVNRPNAGVFRRTPLSAEYNIFDSERYVLTLDNRALRDAAASAPYEFIEILVNERTYGGGGIFNDQATASVDSGFAEYVFVHEFGHHFAALADEYYTSDVAYETGAAPKKEPWEPNVTALLDPASLKWRDLITPGTPLPTPWPKQQFEEQAREFQARRREIRQRNAPEEEMDAHFRRQLEADERVLKSAPYANAVGAFEGASYEARGLYRPQADCIMFTRDRVGFCAVCRRAIGTIIDLYSSR